MPPCLRRITGAGSLLRGVGSRQAIEHEVAEQAPP